MEVCVVSRKNLRSDFDIREENNIMSLIKKMLLLIVLIGLIGAICAEETSGNGVPSSAACHENPSLFGCPPVGEDPTPGPPPSIVNL